MIRTILHLDLDAFYCSVEETLDPELRGKPFAVGGRPDERGVVSSCSYAARRRGVRSAMPMSRAVRLCPELIIVPGRHHLYEEASEKVMDKLHHLTPLVEQISIDEAFLDISDMCEERPEGFLDSVRFLSKPSGRYRPVEKIALDLQTAIKNELLLPCSIGIASNKLVAKIATEVGKKSAKGSGPPFGLTIVPAGQEAAFLAPLPANMLWGVGPKTEAKLSELDLHTIGDIAKRPEQDLVRRFGENGRDLSRHAKGQDDRPIVTEHEIKSISQEITYNVDVRDEKTLEKTLREQAREVARQLRKIDLAGKTVKLKIRWSDFTTLTRQATLPTSTDNEDEIFHTAIKLMKTVRKQNQPVRLIGVGVSGIGSPVRQLSLWDAGSEKSRKLQEVMDALQEKYGRDVIHKGEG